MLNQALNQFNNNIERIKILHSVYLNFQSQVTSVIDVTDILRAEIVLLVSAVDFYIHEIVKIGMLDIFAGNRPETSSFRNYNISLKAIREAIISPRDNTWLEREIIQRHSWKSFQHADKINEALRIISDKDFWSACATAFSLDVQSVKSKLNLIVDRRNKIAHQADMDPSFPGTRWPISDSMVFEAIEFIEVFINSIHVAIEE